MPEVSGGARWSACCSCRRRRPPPLHPLLPFPAADLKVDKLKLGSAVPAGVPRGWMLLKQPRHSPPPAVPPRRTLPSTACRSALLLAGYTPVFDGTVYLPCALARSDDIEVRVVLVQMPRGSLA